MRLEEKRNSPSRLRWIIKRTCLRKRNLTEEEANQIVDECAAKGDLIYFYKCDFCNSHHMTRKSVEPTEKISVI